MPKRNRKKSKQKIEGLAHKILTILRKNHSKLYNYKQLAAILQVDDASSRNQIIKKLKKLQIEGSIEEVDRGKYRVAPSQNYYTGIVDITSRGKGYVIVEDLEEDIFISSKNLNKAFHGDKVEVYLFKRRKRGRNEGEITQILERKKTEFVGTIQVHEKFAVLNCNDSKMYTDLFIPLAKIGNAKDGELVLASLDDWPERAESPYGSVIKVLGQPGEHNTEIHAILAQYGLPYEFPKEVEAYANNLDTSIQDSEINKRKSLSKFTGFLDEQPISSSCSIPLQ